MKGHLGRLITAVVLLPVLYLIIRYSHPFVFFVLVAGGILISQYEFYRFYYPQDHLTKVFLGMVLGFFLSLSFYLEEFRLALNLPLLLLTLITVCATLFSLFTVREIKTALTESAVLLFGVVYVSLLLSQLLLLRGLSDGELLVLFVMGMTWLADAGAYYVGWLVGRHPLVPRISPKKTIEGAVGGLAFSVLGSLGAKFWFLPNLSVGDSVFLGVLLGMVGQLGDLVESLWKRSAGVKDSSTLLIAHGGILDKVDSLMFTAPVFYYYLVLVKDWPGN
ncbi:MAG: phosphatidate cytidylyltransferase [Nitrospira sp.]|nr:phosphatidate cytidylyltransferase [Nitrospira sp.]